MLDPICVHGHVYVPRVNRVPCPWPGKEAHLIGTEHEGVPAYWLEGVLFVLKRSKSWRDYPKVRML